MTRGILADLTLIVSLLVAIAAIAVPLVVWRIKDLLLEIRDELRAARREKAGPPSSRP